MIEFKLCILKAILVGNFSQYYVIHADGLFESSGSTRKCREELNLTAS